VVLLEGVRDRHAHLAGRDEAYFLLCACMKSGRERRASSGTREERRDDARRFRAAVTLFISSSSFLLSDCEQRE